MQTDPTFDPVQAKRALDAYNIENEKFQFIRAPITSNLAAHLEAALAHIERLNTPAEDVAYLANWLQNFHDVLVSDGSGYHPQLERAKDALTRLSAQQVRWKDARREIEADITECRRQYKTKWGGGFIAGSINALNILEIAQHLPAASSPAGERPSQPVGLDQLASPNAGSASPSAKVPAVPQEVEDDALWLESIAAVHAKSGAGDKERRYSRIAALLRQQARELDDEKTLRLEYWNRSEGYRKLIVNLKAQLSALTNGVEAVREAFDAGMEWDQHGELLTAKLFSAFECVALLDQHIPAALAGQRAEHPNSGNWVQDVFKPLPKNELDALKAVDPDVWGEPDDVAQPAAQAGEQPKDRCDGGFPLSPGDGTCPHCGATDDDPCGFEGVNHPSDVPGTGGGR